MKQQLIILHAEHILAIVDDIGECRLVPYHDVVHDVGSRTLLGLVFAVEAEATDIRNIDLVAEVTQQR